MKQFKLILASFIALVLFTSATQFNSTESISAQRQKQIILGTYEDLSAVDFKKLIDDKKFTLVDVRTLKEFQSGHIEGAINIDWYQRTFETEIQKLDKSKPILIYCRSGNRTSKTKFAMLGIGFKKVYNLNYGINDWDRNQFPFVN